MEKGDLNMPKWVVHDQIAEMAGISKAISEQTNRFVDDINPPTEFAEHNDAVKIKRGRKGRLLSLRILARVMTNRKKCELHDRARLWAVIHEDLKWLLETGKTEYIKPYYLHIMVDYVKDSGFNEDDAEYYINRWNTTVGEEYIIPGCEQYYDDVLDFVKNNINAILKIIALEYNNSVIYENINISRRPIMSIIAQRTESCRNMMGNWEAYDLELEKKHKSDSILRQV
jgi:hypothetical protein